VGLPPRAETKQELLTLYRSILEQSKALDCFYGQSLQTIYQSKMDEIETCSTPPEEALQMAKDELSLIERWEQ